MSVDSHGHGLRPAIGLLKLFGRNRTLLERVLLGGFVFALAVSASRAPASSSPAPEDTRLAIEYLLRFVANSDCVFIRNGKSHSPKEAAKHMKDKYDYFKKEIKTPEDFVRLAATKSILSGKPYLVRTKAGKEIECAKWLGKVLEDYRKSRRRPQSLTAACQPAFSRTGSISDAGL